MLKTLKGIFTREEIDILGAEDSVKTLPLFQQIVTGSVAGICEHLGLFPIDTIKTHMQAQGNTTGFFRTFTGLHKHQGIRRFYRGAIPIVIGCVPAHAAFFGTYEFAKSKLKIDDGEYHPITGFLVGACATIIHDAILTPMDVFKQRMQLNGCKRPSRYAKMIIQTEGIHALFRSLPITIMINLPYTSMMVTFNENLKVWVKPEKHKHKFLYYFLCASMAGTVASLVTNPMDVVKTRLQTQNTPVAMKTDICSEVIDVKYKDFLSSVKMMLKEEGVKCFGRGSIPRAMQASVSSALSWVSYEFVKSLFLSKL